MKCKVILRNSLCMVVDYNGIEVQMPTDHSEEEYVNVTKNKNGSYKISEKVKLDDEALIEAANNETTEEVEKETIAELYEV